MEAYYKDEGNIMFLALNIWKGLDKKDIFASYWYTKSTLKNDDVSNTMSINIF